MSKTLKVGAVGLGTWGQNHPLAYFDYHRSELTIVCDKNKELAKEVGEKYNCEWTTDINDVVNSDVEAVSLAVPDFAHFEPAMTLIEGGKHILIEKPLANNLEEARELTKAAKEKGVINMVDFHLRWNPQYMMTKDIVEKGELGKPVMGYIRLSDAIQVAEEWLPWASQSGPEWFLFPHTMDLMNWFIDETPVSVYSLGSKEVLKSKGIDAYDAVQSIVKYPSCFVTFETSWIIPDSNPSVLDCHMSLYGSDGKVDFDQDYTGMAIATEDYSYPWVPVGQKNRFGKLDNYIYEPMRHFVDCVLDEKQPSGTFEDGLINVAMIEASVKSLESGNVEKIENFK